MAADRGAEGVGDGGMMTTMMMTISIEINLELSET